MTQAELLKALAEDLDTTEGKTEDFINALSDLGAETIEKGQPFHLGDLGFLVARRRGVRVIVNFQASKSLRERINDLVRRQILSF